MQEDVPKRRIAYAVITYPLFLAFCLYTLANFNFEYIIGSSLSEGFVVAFSFGFGTAGSLVKDVSLLSNNIKSEASSDQTDLAVRADSDSSGNSIDIGYTTCVDEQVGDDTGSLASFGPKVMGLSAVQKDVSGATHDENPPLLHTFSTRDPSPSLNSAANVIEPDIPGSTQQNKSPPATVVNQNSSPGNPSSLSDRGPSPPPRSRSRSSYYYDPGEQRVVEQVTPFWHKRDPPSASSGGSAVSSPKSQQHDARRKAQHGATLSMGQGKS